MNRTKLMCLFAGIFLLFSCADKNEKVENKEDKQKVEKPKIMWFDAEANFKRFGSQDSIVYYLDKTKAAGFNTVVVDVRPIYGDVLYSKTTLMQPLTKVGNTKIERDWDYLQFFIDEAKKRDMKVTVSTTIFPVGRPSTKEGPAFRSDKFDGLTSIEYTPNGMIDIKDDPSKVAVFLNPLLPESQEYALSFVKEIVENYDVDGYVLDYCRYSGIESDFSEASKVAFEKYIGEEVANFPSDIFRWEGTSRILGKHAKKWFEFRAMVIHDFIERAKNTIKKVNPEIELQYWAASWHHALYPQGQNWGSKSYDPSMIYTSWASSGYKNAGFAEHLDAFMNGAYLNDVYGMDNPESIEYALSKGKTIIDGACKMYGSIYALNYDTMEEAAYLCLKDSEGLVVFDIVQVIEFDLWDELKKGIDRYENE
ncbi:family 10 glycosylhydrolase [Mariniphaga anaerophila]|nr:family 10 glycosylhydrolase [Mariniphaga anaerophila]